MFNKIKTFLINYNWKNFALLNLGVLLSAIASTLFLSPSSLVAGGSTGVSILIEELTGIEYYFFMYAINLFLIIVGFFALGKTFTLKTIYGSIAYPTFAAIIRTSFKALNIDIFSLIGTVDPIFVVGFAAIIMGTGVGLAMKSGGSTGGFDILEAIFLKYFHIPYSVSMYILDALLVISGAIFFNPSSSAIFNSGFAEALGAILYIFLDGFLIDLVTFGGFNKRAVYINSKEYEKIHDYIIKKLARGVTYIDAQGGFSGIETKMIVCICHSREYFILRDAINKIDPNAFIFVTKATEVRGLGYSYETKEHIETRKHLNKNKENID